jgi:acyl-CoA carboxylase subunit beta
MTEFTRTEFWDEGSFQPIDDRLSSRNPLDWPDYTHLLRKARDKAKVDESVQAGPATIGGHEVELALFNFNFMGGSMGEVAGERLARAMERAAERKVPFVLRTETGGARMQEGMVSLVQMPKVVAARLTLADAHQPFLAVLGNPTTGGVLASLGALADFTIAEGEATVGFAGPRLVERFTGRELTVPSHTAWAAGNHGLVDCVTPPEVAGLEITKLLDLLADDDAEPATQEPTKVESAPSSTDAWRSVEKARDRPMTGRAMAMGLSASLVELRGDRSGAPFVSSGEDPAVFASFARVLGRKIMMIALDHAHAPGPRAYRKARRAVKIAERLALPLVTLVDTPGADPSEESEAGGIAWEIAALFEAMLSAAVPTLSVVTGEGGSGGALAFATTDRLLIYEDAYFSVIAPESAAEIIWRDADRGEEAARLLKLTAHDLLTLGIADDVLAGPLLDEQSRQAIAYHLGALLDEDLSGQERSKRRRERWRDPTNRQSR